MPETVQHSEKPQPTTVTVRWFDGYLEKFEGVVAARAGRDLLWLLLSDGTGGTYTRHIPLREVRWFSGVR